MRKIIVLLISSFIIPSHQSECVVSEWGTWSKCYGGCQNGLIVRNRDVLQPPLQELTSEGKLMQRLCPHLYETKFCSPVECNPVQDVLANVVHDKSQKRNITNSAINLVEEQMRKIGFAQQNDPVQAELKKKFISETEQLLRLDEVLSKQFGRTSTSESNNVSIDISSQRLPPNQQQRMHQVVNRENSKWNNVDVSLPTTTATSSYPLDMETTRRSSNTRRLKQPSDSSINTLLKNIEYALDNNQPLDERHIKSAMKRNRKLSKMLLEAYRNNQQTLRTFIPTTPSTTTTLAPTTTTTVTTKAPEMYTEELRTTTITPMLYWPRRGYVPNTRKHASEITSQLYMTNEIVQTLGDDIPKDEIHPDCTVNKRCCKITKETCSDGSIPTNTVKRWYRPAGSINCVAYHYPRCSSQEEMNEQPILFEQNCQDICFDKPEKNISPLFKLEYEDM